MTLTPPSSRFNLDTGLVLFESVLGADAASIDTGAGGIAGVANVLDVFILARTTQAVENSSVTVLVNNDSGANYDVQDLRGNNVTASAANALAQTSLGETVPGASAQAGAVAVLQFTCPGYALTTFHKVFTYLTAYNEDTAGSNQVRAKALRWRNTAAVTRISVTAGSGNLVAGSALVVLGR